MQTLYASDYYMPIIFYQKHFFKFSLLKENLTFALRIGSIYLVLSDQVLETNGVIPFLTGQIGSNEHDDMERLRFGFCVINFLSILSDFLLREKLTKK